MGFGTLLVGYLFLLNISYPAYTDLLAAVIMLYGLYRLSRWNPPLRLSFSLAAAFCLYGCCAFVLAILGMLGLGTPAALSIGLRIFRAVNIGALQVCILLGISSLCREVEYPKLGTRATMLLVLPPVSAVLCALFEIPALFVAFPVKDTALLALGVILFSVLVHVLMLLTIHHAYMRICMPEDLTMAQRPSRFAFVNAYRQSKEQRERQRQEERKKEWINKQQKRRRKK